MRAKLSSLFKGTLVVSGLLLFAIFTVATVILLETNKILGDIFSYFKKLFRKSE